ncbi:peroxiredoxin-like family protein [Sphingomonas sp. TREG-RG-20F-R18-01]|uniref:peroxiredoxin-like family protein n=1 Tax=Sphingomonas sp. TREG-RG-20F-R18-01 TaxID=2914982 RepID=UPI001F58E500|nr:peroxiredoxin-like family protein [Sphingomonas sp. TREG-RG-20F-R18-01]
MHPTVLLLSHKDEDMSVPTKFAAGAAFPDVTWKAVDGTDVIPAKAPGWRMLVIYRGKHCPLCRKYLGQLDEMRGQFADAGLTVWALSSDPLDRARSEAEKEGWSIPVLADLSESEMRMLGLYISSPRSPDETDRNFAEPAVFVINPAGKVQIVDVSNAPFARPDLASLLEGIRFIQAKEYPVRGTAD